MRRLNLWTAIVLIAVPFLEAADLPDYAPDEMIVRFRSSVAAPPQGLSAAGFSSLPSGTARALSLAGATGLKPFKSLRAVRLSAMSSQAVTAFEPLTRTFRVSLPAGSDVQATIKRISQDPAVEYAEPNYRVKLSVTPDDTFFSDQWGMKNTGQSGGIDGFDPALGLAGRDIDAEFAWNAETGSAGTVVAVIDSGLDHTHPDIAGNLWTNPDEIAGNSIDDDGNGLVDDTMGWDFGQNDNDPNDNCGVFEQGHGTHVSGIIGAVGDNGAGVAGVAWDVSLMPLKVAQNDVVCSIFVSDIVDAITYATDEGADVINMSLGTTSNVQTMSDASDAARAAGVVVVAAAGNSGTSTVNYPAGYDSVIGVAATDRRDDKASFSNFGSWVSLAAPGVAIRSTWLQSSGSYAYLSGTSMATPMVAGVAALVRDQYPALTADEVESRLLSSCENIGVANIGSGRINAARALLSVSGVSPATANAGNSITLTLTGVAFHSGISVRLTRSGASTITATSVSVISHDQATADFNIPVDSVGLHNVQVVIGQTVQTLANAVDIKSLKVTAVSPSVWPNTGPTGTVDITGESFASGISFSLEKSGQPDIPGNNVVINSATSAEADFDVTGVAGGRWDVVVTSGSFSSAFSRGLAVTTALYQVVNPPLGSNSMFTMGIAAGTVTLDWPANATTSAIEIDINGAPTLPAIDSNRDPYVATGVGVDLEAVNQSPVFVQPYELTLPYRLSDIPDPTKLSALTIAYFNTQTNRWEPIHDTVVDTANRLVTATVNHFSHFQIVQHVPSLNLDKTIAFPNPFRPDRGHDRIVFDFLTAGSTIKIFDLSGQLVRELSDDDGDGRIDWLDATNEDGDRVASGVYFYLASGGGQKKTGRVAVLR